jgi:hypothetical protein
MRAKTHQGLDKIAELLATALMRVRTKKSSYFGPNARESSLDLSPDQSGDANRSATDNRND